MNILQGAVVGTIKQAFFVVAKSLRVWIIKTGGIMRIRKIIAAGFTILIFAVLSIQLAGQAKEKKMADENNEKRPLKKEIKTEEATFGAGCFWGVEAMFSEVDGVVDTAVGYMGGKTKNPTYKQVCTDRTGHAEVVHLRYDPNEVTYEELLEVFWKIHDPTTLNRQGPDRGKQYRSAIFVYSKEQAEAARLSLAEHQKKIKKKIVTQVAAASTFWRAEEYHQRYFEKNPSKGCHINLPKD